MSATAAASSYWRVAGMSYLKYSNLCADMVRSALKGPAKEAAKQREAIYFRYVDSAQGTLWPGCHVHPCIRVSV